MAGERTEQASAQRREKANREGDRLHSRELSSAAGTLAGVMLLGAVASRFFTIWAATLEAVLAYGRVANWEPATMPRALHGLMGLAMTVLTPVAWVGAGVTGAALGSGVLQMGGVHLHPQVVGFRLDRLNPWSNLKNLVSLRSAARLGKSLIPAAALAVFAIQRLRHQGELPPFSTLRMVEIGQEVYGLLLAAAWLLFAWAVIDFLVEWRSREQRLKMSRQEQREEYRDAEGNPQIRGRIRNLQRQARRRRLQAEVARAAVVITNPTHYAVALEFDFEIMDAPRMLAKGRNLIAEEMKHQAQWAGVPILENAPLARSLYRSVEPGESIPVELYAAVASILAFLYRQRVEESLRQRRRSGTGNRAAPASRVTAPPAEPGIAVIPSSGTARRGQTAGRAQAAAKPAEESAASGFTGSSAGRPSEEPRPNRTNSDANPVRQNGDGDTPPEGGTG
jgi:flagellar biosynthetic protein FlhB